MAGYDPAAETVLHQAVAETIAPIAHMEKQYSGEQMQKMIVDYAGRAAKRKASGAKSWQEVASDFTYSFFESLWKVFGDSPWLDQVDFTWVVASAFRAYLSRPDFLAASEEEVYQIFGKETPLGLDCSRYYSWSAYALKKVVNGKATQKKVRDAVDTHRETLLKENIETAEEFVQSWIQGSIAALGSDVGNLLPKSTAVRLFETYVKEGGGVPLWLMNAATDSVLSEVRNTIDTVYSSIPEDTGSIGAKGGFGGMGGFGKGSSDAWGSFGAAAFGAQWGGKWDGLAGGKGPWGFAPY
jgi:hypothetical protein